MLTGKMQIADASVEDGAPSGDIAFRREGVRGANKGILGPVLESRIHEFFSCSAILSREFADIAGGPFRGLPPDAFLRLFGTGEADKGMSMSFLFLCGMPGQFDSAVGGKVGRQF